MDDRSEVESDSEDESSDSDGEVWISYRGKEPLNDFLEINRPSKLSISDATWISVSHVKVQDDEASDDERQDDEVQDDVQNDIQENDGKQQPNELDKQTVDEDQENKLQRHVQEHEGEEGEEGEDEGPPDTDTEQSKSKSRIIKKEWKRILENEQRVTKEMLKELAQKYDYTSGKWMVFASSNHVDHLWFNIAKGVMAGKLGDTANVSTRNPEERSHVICVFTKDFTDKDDVRRVEKGLRDLGMYGKLSYKPDIYTLLGIYRKNDLGIAASIYKSEAVATASSVNDYKWREETGNTKGHRVVDCLRYDGKESFDSFLERNKPSQVNGRDALWISVSYGQHDPHYCRDVLSIEAEWKELQKERGIKLFGAAFLKDLAVKYRYTCGKWMIFTNRYEVDDYWFSVAEAVIAGRLGNETKVSTKKPNEDHVIFVYTKDFTDECDVRRVERGLRSAGIRTVMSYKPDIYTSLRISAKNDLGISPTIFTSRNHRSGSHRY